MLAALGVEVTPIKTGGCAPQEERRIAGSEDILRIIDTQGRAPHGEDRDISERLYAVRLDRLQALTAAHPLLAPLDKHALLTKATGSESPDQGDALDDEALLEELGLQGEPFEDDFTALRHVRSREERNAAEEIANRTRCDGFDQVKPLFERVQRELGSGERKTIRLGTRSLDEIQQGTFFIVGGQLAYVAEEKGEFTTRYERRDMRLRVIYANGTDDLASTPTPPTPGSATVTPSRRFSRLRRRAGQFRRVWREPQGGRRDPAVHH